MIWFIPTFVKLMSLRVEFNNPGIATYCDIGYSTLVCIECDVSTVHIDILRKSKTLKTAKMILEFDINFNKVKFQHHVVLQGMIGIGGGVGGCGCNQEGHTNIHKVYC